MQSTRITAKYRRKVQCTKCGSIFNSDFKKKHESIKHNGAVVQIKEFQQQQQTHERKNPFEAAASLGKRKTETETEEIQNKKLNVSTYLADLIKNLLIIIEVGRYTFCLYIKGPYVCVRIKRYHVVDYRKGDIGQNRKKSQKC